MKKWLCFEGPDRSGKSVQLGLLNEFLTSVGMHVLCVSDPSKDVAVDIRKLLLGTSYHPTTDMLLYVAARHELYQQIMSQADAYDVVLCDRYLLSTMVFQHTVAPDDILQVHRLAGMTIDPDAYLLYLPITKLSAELENHRDEMYDERFDEIKARYEALAPLAGAHHACHFRDESPESIFERFTKPFALKHLS